MRNRIPHLDATLLRFGVYLMSLELSIQESLSLPDRDVLSCKSLFYRRVIVIWIVIYLWGIKSPPRKYVQIFMSECVMMIVVGRRYMKNAEEVLWVE